LSSWDRFLIPLPFGRGLFVYGEPIFVRRDGDREEQERVRRELEIVLHRLTADADARFGRVEAPPHAG
jgi:lysophospholipid acyltransferase (LPLAT)-like uncharacterized protein